MQTNNPCVLIHIRKEGEVGATKHNILKPLMIFSLTIPRWCFFFDHFSYLGFTLSLSYSPVCFLQPCDHLLRKAGISALLCQKFHCVFVTFPIAVFGQAWYLDVLISDLYLLLYFLEYFSILCIEKYPPFPGGPVF